MIRGIYAKIFLWFTFATVMTSMSVWLISILTHSRSFGPRWMTGVLNQYARSAVDIYIYGGKTRLAEYLDEIAESSHMQATLLGPDGRDILGRGIPAGTEGVLAQARAAGHTRFQIGMRWRGASVIGRPEGDFILVAEVLPYGQFASWWALRTPILRLIMVLFSGGLLCLLLARHIAAPIRALQTVAGRIADGDLSVRATPAISPRNDELSDLARDFDRMADRIQSLLQKQQELLADVSHELRSPLTRLSVSLELVRRGDVDGVERMQTDLNRLDALIGQILTLTRLQAHHDQKTEAPVNLRLILESVVEDARFEGQEQQKSAVITHSEDCWLRGDSTLLRSCMENVVRNAIRYTKPRTDVVVSLDFVDSDARSARILVLDQGEGVPREALHRLFEPFYRVSPSRDHQTGGTGLGLSIAQRIVSLYGGTILARNRAGGGLEMEICFPVQNSLPSATAYAYPQTHH